MYGAQTINDKTNIYNIHIYIYIYLFVCTCYKEIKDSYLNMQLIALFFSDANIAAVIVTISNCFRNV